MASVLSGSCTSPPRTGELDVAVLLLSPGVKNRVAPHRLYNKMAATFVEQGYWVLRFDFSGLGDSEGVINEPYLADLYGTRGPRPLRDRHRGCNGLAARAIPGQSVRARGPLRGGDHWCPRCAAAIDVAGLLGLGLPLMVEGRNIDPHRNVTAGQLNRLRGQYLKKLASPRAWVRLLSLRTDWRMAVKSVVDRKRKPRPAAAGRSSAALRFRATTRTSSSPPAFLQLLERGCPALLLFSEMDRLWWEFDEKFLVSHRPALAKYGTLLEVGIVPGANHTFTLEEWQADMMSQGRRLVRPTVPVASGQSPDVRPADGPRGSGRPGMKILVTDGSTRPALAITRSLGRSGHTVLVAERSSPVLAQTSRFCAGRVRHPDPARDEDGAIDALAEAAERHGVDVVIPVTDITVSLVTRHRHRFEPRCRVPFATAERIALANDKAQLLRTGRAARRSRSEELASRAAR